MTPNEFILKWRDNPLTERQASHTHFIDLCKLLDEPAPYDPGTDPDSYCFEKGATKITGSDGWADVWKRGAFGWEYKGPRKDLRAAYVQLQQYAVALENPPLLIACDREQFRVHTNFTNSVSEVHEIKLDELIDPDKRAILKAVFNNPDALRPGKTRQSLTVEVAQEFATLAQRLRDRGHDPQSAAHFINRLVFCMFAEDVTLLPNDMFKRMLEHAEREPAEFQNLARDLFRVMQAGGRVGFERVEWFNGGLFDHDEALPLKVEDIRLVLRVARENWSDVDPSILGTLFERGLDPDKRSQLGAHYTDRDKIRQIVDPVVLQPLLVEWAEVRERIAAQMANVREARERRPSAQAEARKVHAVARRDEERAWREAQRLRAEFIERLRNIRVLDPACGSGNFLYLALLGLKDIEHRVNLDSEVLGLGRFAPTVGPECLKGIEKNAYAAELARVSVWIGEIQWMRRNGFDVSRNPILRPLDTIECRDAILNSDGTEAVWPEANFVVGNPPFLGDREHRLMLGEDYTLRLRQSYSGRVPARADLVVYWVEKAVEKVLANEIEAFGLVATKSIAKGASRTALDRLSSADGNLLFNAWTNQPWIVEGAAVRVSIVCGASPNRRRYFSDPPCLNGGTVARINPDLTSGVDVTTAKPLSQNKKVAFQGVKLTGPFDIPGEDARRLLVLPLNPNGRPNSDVIARLYDIDDVVGRDSDRWVVDFGTDLSEEQAALYEEPFRIVTGKVVPFRANPELCRSSERRLRDRYWEFQRPRPEMRNALRDEQRFIVTPESSEHRIFIFAPSRVLIQGSLFAIARDDEVTFGILSSRIHEVWATAQGNRLGVGNQRRYNITVTFETFPFPEEMTPERSSDSSANVPAATAIAESATRLLQLRNAWMNPPDLVRREPEVLAGYPDRLVAVSEIAAETLKSRTLTNLYNENPPWLKNAHAALDASVFAAYGISPTLPDGEILEFLLALNHRRQGEPSA